MKFSRAFVISTLLLASMAHGGCHGEEDIYGPPTQAACPTGSTLTYNNFGKQFMESYCTKCHASDKMGEARQGAPSFHDFDTLNGIVVVADHIDETAASGPAATNLGMPADNLKPSLAERQMLGEWIACGLPEQ